jgi:POT family proton-dependent oligopeptide transporter
MGERDRHPKGLYVLFFTEMWERFGFYSMLAMFTLYLKDDKQGFGWTSEDATRLYSNYLMFVYASPLVGGLIADRGLGYRRSVMIGGVIFMVGYLLLAVPALWAVYLALTCLVVGNGFFKPNVSAMVGHLYPEGSPLKDRAYNIFYMGINIGAFLAPVVAEFVQSKLGFGPAFTVAAGGMVVSVAILWIFKHYVEGPARQAAPPAQADAEQTAVTADVPPQPEPARPAVAIDAVPDWMRVGALVVIFLIVIVFWMVFHQNGSTLTYWANDNTDWNVSGIISNAINPFWVVTLTFPLVWVWGQLNKRGLEPSTPMKMTLGMFLTAASFTLLYFAARTGEAKEVRPETFPTGNFLVNDRALEFMKADGVPQDVTDKLGKAKGKDDRFIVMGRKFSTDATFAAALDTIRLNLQSEGVPPEDWAHLKDAKIGEGTFAGGGNFSEALDALIADLRAKGVSSDTLQRMEAYRQDSFTGEAKFEAALGRVLAPEQVSTYRAEVLKRAFLFRVSPLWLIIAYAIVTLGELMLSPMGLSLVSKVAPIKIRGLMMGGWFVATAIGNKLTMIGVFWDRWLQSTFFIVLAAMALVMGVVLLVLLRPLKKAMPGV